jgi:hypothetical protein
MVSTNKDINGDNMEGASKKAIFALSFGQGANGTPGKSNKALAEVVKKLHEESSLPMLLQWEIADCVSGLIKEGRDLVVRKHRAEGKYLDTREVIAQAWEFAKKRGIKKVIVVAHPDHAPRCAAVAAKIGFDVEIANTLEIPYDPESTQDWTRSAVVFKPREEMAMEYYRQLGYID